MKNILLKLFEDKLLFDIKKNKIINNFINVQYPSIINIINKYNIIIINNNTHVENIINNPFIPEIILDYIKNKIKLQYHLSEISSKTLSSILNGKCQW